MTAADDRKQAERLFAVVVASDGKEGALYTDDDVASFALTMLKAIPVGQETDASKALLARVAAHAGASTTMSAADVQAKLQAFVVAHPPPPALMAAFERAARDEVAAGGGGAGAVATAFAAFAGEQTSREGLQPGAVDKAKSPMSILLGEKTKK